MGSGKYSPTVTLAYWTNQHWHKEQANEQGYDKDGYDRYGYNADGVDRAGHTENNYICDEDLLHRVSDLWRSTDVGSAEVRELKLKTYMNGHMARRVAQVMNKQFGERGLFLVKDHVKVVVQKRFPWDDDECSRMINIMRGIEAATLTPE